MLFKAVDVHASYGAGDVLKGIDVAIEKGEVVSILGANGAGKSTLARVISGLMRISKGSLEFEGVPIENKSADYRVRHGIAMCPEDRKLFPQMTVLENLRMGAFLISDKKIITQSMSDIFELFPRLLERKSQLAGTLSGGEQQMLTLSRALMSQPKMLILDEPTIGLAPMVIEVIYQVIVEIASRGTTLMLVEQNASIALEISNRGYVLETGMISLHGTKEELKSDPRVKEAYLGG
ncbi:MAG: ABC transporter ATP-binding protein [Pseudomonadota bacterium]